MSRPLPETASVALPLEGAMLSAPSALRNRGAIADLLEHAAPPPGPALEIASGTGEHVVVFAARLPDLDWQPTDVASDRRASIDAHAARSGLENIRPARDLDAARPGWHDVHSGLSLVVIVNLLHLIGDAEAATVLSEAAAALAPGGRLVIYGPFLRGGELTSSGDRAFHEALQASDPAIGYKDDFDTLDRLVDAGLEILDVVEMPANNLGIVAARPAT